MMQCGAEARVGHEDSPNLNMNSAGIRRNLSLWNCTVLGRLPIIASIDTRNLKTTWEKVRRRCFARWDRC